VISSGEGYVGFEDVGFIDNPDGGEMSSWCNVVDVETLEASCSECAWEREEREVVLDDVD